MLKPPRWGFEKSDSQFLVQSKPRSLLGPNLEFSDDSCQSRHGCWRDGPAALVGPPPVGTAFLPLSSRLQETTAVPQKWRWRAQPTCFSGLLPSGRPVELPSVRRTLPQGLGVIEFHESAQADTGHLCVPFHFTSVF